MRSGPELRRVGWMKVTLSVVTSGKRERWKKAGGEELVGML